MEPIPDPLIHQLDSANRIVALTGAGISAESGVPTFREAQTGLWAQYDPTDLATPEAYARDPATMWSWYCWRRNKVLSVEPNAGHHALVALQAMVPELLVATQNVDQLHQRAGSQTVIELHGTIMRARCFARGHMADAWPEPDTPEPPLCPICSSPLRPDVVWFGESLPPEAIQRAWQAASRCDVLLSIGTSSVVYPAAGIAEVALQHGACVIEVNPDETPLSQSASFVLRGPAGEVLPRVVEQLQVQRRRD